MKVRLMTLPSGKLTDMVSLIGETDCWPMIGKPFTMTCKIHDVTTPFKTSPLVSVNEFPNGWELKTAIAEYFLEIRS